MKVIAANQVPPAEREAAAKRAVAEEACRPFDLARGPLLRCLLTRLGEREHVLVIVLHHIISDGWSLAVLAEEANQQWTARFNPRQVTETDLLRIYEAAL